MDDEPKEDEHRERTPTPRKYRCLIGATAHASAVVEVEAGDRRQAARLARARVESGEAALDVRRVDDRTIAVGAVLLVTNYNVPGQRPDDQLPHRGRTARGPEPG